jgi:hypothetical protein
MVEHYSHKIQNAIQKELFKANSSIKIAVAWFTNDLLFQPLLLKLGAGVSVELILNKDDINCSDDNEVDFDKFVKAGGVLRWNDTKQLMHDKFCIIDNKIVIFGSYNWTNKAEYNEESITISRDENETIKFYNEKFEKLSGMYIAEKHYKNITFTNTSKEAKSSFQKDEELKSGFINQAFIDKACSKGHFPSQSLIPKVKSNLYATVFEEYPVLNFYDKIVLFSDSKDPFHLVAKSHDLFFFIDEQNFTPINAVCFTDYRYVGDYGGQYYPKLQIIWIKVDDKWGLYDKEQKKFCIPPICDEFVIQGQNFELFEIIVNGKHGVADIGSKIILDWAFDEVEIRGSNLFRVKVGDKYAIIEKGKVVVNFDESDHYHGITKSRGKYGLISYDGKIILDFIYDDIDYNEPFGAGYFVLHKNGKCAIRVRKNGKTTPCIYGQKHEDWPIGGFSGDEVLLKEGTPLE